MAPLWGVCEVAMSQILSVCADELRTRAVVHMSKASLPLGQPHHYSTSSDVSLLMQRPRAKLGDGSSLSDKLFNFLTQQLVVDHASQLSRSMYHCHDGLRGASSMQKAQVRHQTLSNVLGRE